MVRRQWRSGSPISRLPGAFRAPGQKRKFFAIKFLKRREAVVAGRSSARVLSKPEAGGKCRGWAQGPPTGYQRGAKRMKASHPCRAHSASHAHLLAPLGAPRVRRAGGVGVGSGCLWGRRASTEGAQPARGLAGPLERRRGESAVQCAPRCVRLWLGARCITPFIALGLAARPSPGYQSQADVMLLIASPENQPN